MKIENIDLSDENIGAKVTYIPPHADGNAGHIDAEGGTISSWNDSYVFINFGYGTNHATKPIDIVWG